MKAGRVDMGEGWVDDVVSGRMEKEPEDVEAMGEDRGSWAATRPPARREKGRRRELLAQA